MKFGSKKQSSFKSTFQAGALAACLLASGLGANFQTAHAADAVVKIGVLDEVKLGEGYTEYHNQMEKLDVRAKAVQDQVGARRFLSAAEGARFDALNKPNRTPAEETDFVALIKIGQERIEQYKTLSGQAIKNDTEKKSFNDMQDYQKANLEIADKLEDVAFRELRTIQDSTDKKYIDKANAMVQQVAVDQKLTVLLRKDAIVWSTPTVDITDAVLKRLNDAPQ